MASIGGAMVIKYSLGNTMFSQMVTLMLYMTGFSIFSGFLVGYVLVPLLLLVHKKLIGRKMVFFFEEKPASNRLKDYLIKGLYPTFIILNFCIILSKNELLQDLLLVDTVAPGIDAIIDTFMALFPFATLAVTAIFSPVWFLLDAEIMYSNIGRATTKPTKVKSVGEWYMDLLKGYAGISVIMAYVQLYIDLVTGFKITPGYETAQIALLIMFPAMPALFLYLYVPLFILLDLTFQSRRKYVRRIAKKLGITEVKEIYFK